MSSPKKLYIGIDAGSRAVKAVALNEQGACVGSWLESQDTQQLKVVEKTLAHLLQHCDASREDVARIVTTGYARHLITFADEKITEITCHAHGIHTLFPEARTLIEMGGQDSKIISLNAKGKVKEFMMNDRCAAGTGRFLEVVADRLKIPMEKFADFVNDPEAQSNPITMSSMCVVFAETEIIGLLASDVPPGRILAGVQNAVCTRVISMAKQIHAEGPFVFTGGVALISGMRTAIEHILGVPVLVPQHPQFTGALGAAEFARTHGA